MKLIALTGANGFIGRRLYSYLSGLGHEVVCLVRKSSDVSGLPVTAKIVRIDYNDQDQLKEVLEQCNILIHLAALTRAKKWSEFKKINVDLVENLVQVANQISNLEQFVFLSSQAASGPARSGIGKRESDENEPVSMYGKSKLAAEEIVRSQCKTNWTIVRPVSVFGQGDSDFYEYYKMINKGIAPLVGLSNRYISLIHVDDLCRLVSLTLDNSAAYNQIFFAASSEQLSMAGFAYMIAQAMHKKIINLRIPIPVLFIAALLSEILFINSKRPPVYNREKFREMIQKYWLASNKKACDLLNYNQQSTLTRQMVKTIKWYRDNKLL